MSADTASIFYAICELFQLPACSLSIQQGSERIDLAHGNVNADTIFPIASISKSFLAASICVAVGEGLLDFDKPIRFYWPNFKMIDPYATEHLTLRDALSHRCGLPRHDLMRFSNGDIPLEELVYKIRFLAPNCEIRIKMQYQNLIYALATHILEKVTSKSYEDFLRDRLLVPLGLSQTYTNEFQCKATMPKAYALNEGRLVALPPMFTGNVGGASGMASSTGDLLAWAMFHKNGAGSMGFAPFFEQMQQPQTIMSNNAIHGWAFPESDFRSAGMGLMLERYQGYRYVYVEGVAEGYRSHLGFIPELDLSFSMLTNLHQTDALCAMAYSIIDSAANLPQINWKTRIRKTTEERDSKKKKAFDFLLKHAMPSDSAPSRGVVGQYKNDGYGTVAILEEQQRILIQIGSATLPVIQTAPNSYIIDARRFGFLIPLSFVEDATGTVVGLDIQTDEKTLHPTRFKRR